MSKTSLQKQSAQQFLESHQRHRRLDSSIGWHPKIGGFRQVLVTTTVSCSFIVGGDLGSFTIYWYWWNMDMTRVLASLNWHRLIDFPRSWRCHDLKN